MGAGPGGGPNRDRQVPAAGVSGVLSLRARRWRVKLKSFQPSIFYFRLGQPGLHWPSESAGIVQAHTSVRPVPAPRSCCAALAGPHAGVRDRPTCAGTAALPPAPRRPADLPAPRRQAAGDKPEPFACRDPRPSLTGSPAPRVCPCPSGETKIVDSESLNFKTSSWASLPPAP